jgi:hypothetical protein
MITTAVIAPFAGTVGGGFFLGYLAGFAIKKVLKLAAVVVGSFIAALAYLEYQRIVSVDRNRIQFPRMDLCGLRMQSRIYQVPLAQLTRYLILVFLLHQVLRLEWF